MPPVVFDAIVLGLGTMGAAAAAELARRGRRTLGLERFGLAHDRGSHHGRSRMVRLAYYEHPDYIPLLRRSIELWHALNAASGREIFTRTGGLYMGEPGGELIRGSLAAAVEHGLPHERWSAPEVRSRFDAFTPPDAFSAMLEPDAGLVVPEEAVRAFARLAVERGAEIRTGERVIGWREAEGSVEVTTERGRYRSASLIIAAGAWAGSLAPGFRPLLRVTRQVLAWFRPREPLGGIPVWAVEDPELGLLYGFPMRAGEPGIKVAIHKPGAPTDPDRHDRAVGPEDIEPIRRGAERYLPAAAGDLVDSCTCLYTNSPDGHFIIDRVPGAARVFAACGFSGHGFKFAPVMGEILADLAIDGRTEHPIGFLSPARFAE